MLKIIFLVIVIIATTLGVKWFDENDGVMVIDWLGKNIEMSVSIALVAFTIFLLLLILFIRFVYFLFAMPKIIFRRDNARKYDKAIIEIGRALSAGAVSDQEKMSNSLRKLDKLLPKEKPYHISDILFLQKARLEGDVEEERLILEKLKNNKETKFMAVRGLITSENNAGNKIRALEHAEELFHDRPSTKSLVPTLLLLYKQTRKWQKAKVFLEKVRRYINKIDKEDAAEFNLKEEQARILYMIALDALEEKDFDAAFKFAKKAYDYNPKDLNNLLLYIDISIKYSRINLALTKVKNFWKENPSNLLTKKVIELISSEKKTKQLRLAKNIASAKKNHFESHALIANIAFANDDFSTAKDFAEKAVKLNSRKDVYAILYEIEKRSDNPDEMDLKRLQAKLDNLKVDQSFKCNSCKKIHPHYLVTCDNCGAVEEISLQEVFTEDRGILVV